MQTILAIYFFWIGAALGSFFNVLLDRIPRKESVIFPSSHCDSCGYKIKWYENIPIVSYIFLKGKCRKCGAKIGMRSVIIEVLFGLIFGIIGFILVIK